MNNIDEIYGLTSQVANKRLELDGYNEIVLEKPKTILNFVIDIVKEPMILLLLISSTIYFLLGDPREAGILLISVLGVVLITIYQEQKTEKSIQALKSLASPFAEVIREGNTFKIPAREIVVGDIINFSEGDKIPADAKIISCSNLMVDESLLTGESVAVTKTDSTGGDNKIQIGGDNLSFVFCSTLVTKGHGVAEVIATGIQSQVGIIGKELQSLKIEKTLLQSEVSKMVKLFASVGLFFCLFLIIIYGVTRHDWLHALLAGITLAMGTLPEEFPIVLTLFLAMGAWRLAQNKVLARRAATIETLGSASVLCVDKTGTLTQNKMDISEIFAFDKYFNNENLTDQSLNGIFILGVLASQKNPFDPMEKAFLAAEKKYVKAGSNQADLTLIKEYPLEKSSLSVVYAYEQKDGKVLVAAKGSHETIIDLCHLDNEKNKVYHDRAEEMAKKGFRVIALAKTILDKNCLPDNRHDFHFEFVGLIGLADPIREEIGEAVKICHTAGIRIVMITGDFPETAKSIASQIGLSNTEEVITGHELEAMTEADLVEKIKSVNIFSRVIPEQKLQIVNALKKSGEIVAMTGDGVNDAPALKSAHVGIAMGQHGTDVAREAAAIVLLDDNFVSIVNGIRLGRRIYDNLRKAMTYIIAVHIPVIGLSLLPVLFGWPLILLPVHIVFLELVIDPACTIVFENEKAESSIMERKPRKLNEPIFSRQMIILSLIQGFIALLAVLVALRFSTWFGLSEGQTRAFAFATLVFSNLLLIIANRSWHHSFLKVIFTKNIAFLIIVSTSIFVLILSIYLPVFRNIFSFEPLPISIFFDALLLGFFSIIWFDFYKYFLAKKISNLFLQTKPR